MSNKIGTPDGLQLLFFLIDGSRMNFINGCQSISGPSFGSAIICAQLLWALWHQRVLRRQQHVLFASACNEPVIWLCIAGGDCGNNSGAIFMRHCAECRMSENLRLNACWQHISVYRNIVNWGERHRMALLLVVVVATCRCSLARSLAGC